MGSQLTWEPGQYMGARPTILQNQDVARVSRHSVSSTAPCISMILLLSRYAVLAMTETNTVWYVKTQGCSYPCKQKRKWREFRVWGEDSLKIKCKWVDFQYTRLKPWNRCRIYKCSDWAAGKYQEREGERERWCSRGPTLPWLAPPQRECQPTPEAIQLQHEIRDL